jgi:hypothetical protein
MIPVERKLSKFILLHPLLRSCAGENPTVCRRDYFSLLPLIVPSGNVNTSTVPDRGPEVPPSNECAEPSAAADEKESGWKSTASATAKLLLRGVRDSADAFGPLKSVASGLCFVLDNCEVCPSSHTLSTTLTGAAANEGKSASDRIVGTPSQNAR